MKKIELEKFNKPDAGRNSRARERERERERVNPLLKKLILALCQKFNMNRDILRRYLVIKKSRRMLLLSILIGRKILPFSRGSIFGLCCRSVLKNMEL